MAIPNLKTLKKAGFTLVELLIVVAIIGVLSTIGVPTFRRMIQKAKKSEAKVNLGGLYTSEQAFFAEYGGYGNRLTKIGFQVDGTNMIYRVGFPGAIGCAGAFALGSIVPAQAGAIGANINLVYPAYYNPLDAATETNNNGNGFVTGNAIAAGNRLTTCASAAAQGNIAAKADVNPSVVGAVEAATFLATASGVIAPGISKTAPAMTDIDVWSMNEQRQLINSQDGVR